MTDRRNDMAECNPQDWLTTGQAAAFLKLAPGTLQNWRTLGKGPMFVKHGNNVYYPKDALMDYLYNHRKLYSSTTQWKTQEKLK